MLANRPNLRGALFALLAFAVFSTHDVVVKLLGESLSPIQVVFFSVLLGFPLVVLLLLGQAKANTLRPRHPWWMALRTAAVVVTATSAFYAFSSLPLTQTYAILFASPLIITLLAIPILGEKVGWRRGLAVLIGLGGVLVVLRPGSEPLSLGHIAAVLAALGGSLASVIVRKIGNEERRESLLLYPMITNFIVMGMALPLVYEPMTLSQLYLLMVVAGLAFCATLMIIAAYKSGEAVIVAPMQYSQIIWASIFGYVFFRESPDVYTIIGASIIIASGIYIVLRENTSSVSENQPVLRTRSRVASPSAPRVAPFLKGPSTDDDKAD